MRPVRSDDTHSLASTLLNVDQRMRVLKASQPLRLNLDYR